MTLNEEVAVEVMGWEKRRDVSTTGKCIYDHGTYYMTPEGRRVNDIYFDSDLNQARMVTEKGVEVLMELCPHEEHKKEWALTMIDRQLEAVIGNWKSSQFRALTATANQICQAVLMAVREARK